MSTATADGVTAEELAEFRKAGPFRRDGLLPRDEVGAALATIRRSRNSWLADVLDTAR